MGGFQPPTLMTQTPAMWAGSLSLCWWMTGTRCRSFPGCRWSKCQPLAKRLASAVVSQTELGSKLRKGKSRTALLQVMVSLTTRWHLWL